MKQLYFVLSRDISFNGNLIEIQIEVKKEELNNKIVTKKTHTDSDGNVWNIVGEKEVENLSRDQFG